MLILPFNTFQMDSELHQLFHEYAQHARSDSFNHSEHPEAQCIVCRRYYTSGTGESEVPESISICRECKSLVVDDNEATPPIRNFRRRRQRRGRASRYGSSESIEDLFSHQFSQLISLVRQNHEIQGEDGDATSAAHPRTSYSPARNWPRSWRRPLSDNDTESLDHGDSLFGESDSNISFYGGDSETSFDGHSLLGREMFTQQDHDSHFYTDTDIDPMHAGLDQWNSDDEDEDEDVEWEEVNVEEASIHLVEQQGHNLETFNSPNGSMNSAQDGRWIRWRAHQADLFADLEDPDVMHVPLFGNTGDYLDARGFEELLEHLAENDDSRRGAPPASSSAVGSLPHVIISKDHEKNGSLVCPVCKDPLATDTEANQLPCLHLYHPTCILPWLKARNSCPVCRYELPTDDPEYEEGKRGMGRSETHEIHQQNQAESFSDESSDMEVDDAQVELAEAIPEQAEAGNGDGSSSGSSGGRSWYFIAAAPIASIVGIALALWFRNSMGERRIQCRIEERNLQQPHRSHGESAIAGRSRRWLPFF